VATTVAVTLPKITAAAEAEFGVDQLRGFITSALGDAALGSLLRSALDSIDDFLGPTTLTEHLRSAGDVLSLGVEADTIVSVIENENGTPVTLDATDYDLPNRGQVLRRLGTGTHPAHWRYARPIGRQPHWLGSVAVTYVRRADADARIRVAVALVQLDLNHHPGMASEQIGTWTEQYANRAIKPYDEDREDILRSLIRNDNDDFVF
jgi:hypothetical protein